ncbi:MAG: hypothetical protein IT359_02510 [Gemmatimonadaceae bacterium]|nr:hypothetical protein [Gemmatimonadaceae bacterium]
MPDIGRMLLHGGALSLLASLFLLACLLLRPRLLLQDYPDAIQSVVPPKTDDERRMTLVVGIPFLVLLLFFPVWSSWTLPMHDGHAASFGALFVNTFVVASTFNVFDWLVLDWLLVCTLTPRFLVIPGTEGMRAYKDYAFHFRGFVIGTGLSLALALVTATIVRIVRP